MSSGEVQYLKILLIGDSAVGKTSVLLRYTEDTFSPDHISTIGCDYKVKEVTIMGKDVKMQIWDTAGQERFRTITSSYYRGAKGIMLVFDLTEEETFKNVKQWLTEIQRYAHEGIPIILCGNKSDLSGERQVLTKSAENFSQTSGLKGYHETSAKEGKNVNEAFTDLVQTILTQGQENNRDNDEFRVVESSPSGKKKIVCNI